MSLSRQEVNIRRLLAKCELMVKNNQSDDSRFMKYVESLSNMINEFQDLTDSDTTSQYKRRIMNLRKLISKNLEINNEICNSEDKNPTIPKTAREELLGMDNVRLRKMKAGEDLDDLLQYHNSMQERIADDMLILTRNLKEQSQLANKIIKQDTNVALKSTTLAERNLTDLKTESEKLADHSRRACKCWMWIILIIVMVIFINMVLFMKVMKKRI